jgi:EAL domain-containing protein (putative c-di-GMP-specific phosphodiesterase class I)
MTLSAGLSASTDRLRHDRSLIEHLIEDPTPLGPDFAPVKSLSDGSLIAYKATGRGQRGTELDTTLSLLASAQSNGLMERLDWAFRCLALDVAVDHGVTAELHLTPEPETFGTMCPPRLATSFGRGRRLIKVGAEVQAAAFATTSLEGMANEWRGLGWRIIVADVSELYDREFISRLALLHPDVVQVDLNKPRRESDPGVLGILNWAKGAGVEIHALGVDNELRREQAMDLGATAGRGWYYGAPAPL